MERFDASRGDRPAGDAGEVEGTRRVLIVDDDPALRILVRQVLGRRNGWEVVGEAGDGWTAVEIVESLSPDVILLDLVMEGPGDEVLPPLLRLAPRCMVAVLSGLDGQEQRDRLLRLGAFSYYPKSQVLELPDLLEADYDRFRRALTGEDIVLPWVGQPIASQPTTTER